MMKRNATGICKEVQQTFASLRYVKRNMENYLMTVLGVSDDSSGSMVSEIGYWCSSFFSRGSY